MQVRGCGSKRPVRRRYGHGVETKSCAKTVDGVRYAVPRAGRAFWKKRSSCFGFLCGIYTSVVAGLEIQVVGCVARGVGVARRKCRRYLHGALQDGEDVDM